MRWVVLVVLLGWMGDAWAHPGPLDACFGHTATERVEYPPNPAGEPSYASEPEEYHFHFTPQQMDEDVLPSLSRYRRTHPASTSLGIDSGSFTVGGHTYDIWEYTRNQREAILHCRGDDAVMHTGIARVRP